MASARGAGRRLLAAALPVAAISFAWGSLEVDARTGAFAGIAALALLTAVPARMAARIAVALGTLVGLTLLVAGTTAHEVRRVADRGLSDIYAVAPPLVPKDHRELHVLVLLTAAAFCLAAAATAGTRPFVAAAVTAAGLGWPATVLPARNTLAMGVLGLLAALWPVLVSGARDRRAIVPGATMLAGVVVAAVVLAGAGAKPSVAALDWQSWDFFGQARAERTVALIWSSDYGGIDRPSGTTTVLRVMAPRRALYWRATTLDLFAQDHWIEALYNTDASGAERLLPADPLLPARAARRAGWVKQEVDVRALVDDHVIAAGQPMQIAAGPKHRLTYLSGGVMRSPGGLGEMRRYTVWSYVPRPTPAALVKSPPAYPRELYRYLDVGRAIVPDFGYPKRDAIVASLFRDERYQPLWPYQALWRDAHRLTARAGSPYEATVTIERWLRSDGGFGYDERPPAPVGLPPLVDFLERSKLGYCQQFAGSMALMLRYLGIPARVAVGFTSGKWKDGGWTVTDRDAHAWVEAWFAGYGWLAFDPTPGQGRLSATYTNASDSADAIRALGTGRFLGSEPNKTAPAPRNLPPLEQPSADAVWWPYLLPLAALAAVLLTLALVKSIRRYRRAATRDPRRRASAARADLADFVRDQGSGVPAHAPMTELAAELRRLGVASDGFAAAFSRARYGPAAGAAAAADDARRELERVLALLRDRLGPGRRVRGFLALRSLRGD